MRLANRKKTVIFLGGLLLILAIVILAVPRLIDLNHYNAPIVATIEKIL